MAEKSLNEIPRNLREQFDRGMAAYHKNNLDYAITLFADTLQKEPAFYDCREALRAAQFRRGGKSGIFRRLLGQASPGLAKAQIALRSSPADAMAAAEQVLNEDPKSAAAHEVLARAAMELGLPRTAVLSLEIAFKNAPENRDVALKLAAAYIAAGQASKADRIYADLLAANPADAEVARAYKDLGARRTMHEKGYAALEAGEGSYRDILKDKAEATILEQEKRQVKAEDVADRLIREQQARLDSDPADLRALRALADLHVQKLEFEAALNAYERIAQAEGGSDAALARTIAETRLRQFNHRIAQIDPSDPDADVKRAALKTERDAFQLEECRSRLERYPADLAIRFELGRLYFQADRIGDAIQELQKAQNHPHHRVAALGLLARCFSKRGIQDVAARTLQNALREKPVLDDEKKELIYELGCVLDRWGKPEEAIEQFKLIYEADIGFRDVGARVDAYYASRSS